MGSLKRAMFGISGKHVRFDQRGFRWGRPETRQRLEHVGSTFLIGYHAALDTADGDRIAEQIEQVELADRGFAFEGAAMALALLDKFLPGSRTLKALMEAQGKRHIYMLHIGAGWALARLPWKIQIDPAIAGFDALLRWLVVDGFGFHEGYFHWRGDSAPNPPRGGSPEALHAFDQGLGRALWFKQCGDPEAIARTIRGFPEFRRRDLWGGLGLAASYAGGVSREVLSELAAISDHVPALAQGAVFAANARERAGNPAPHTELACSIFCGASAKRAAQIADQVLEDLRSATKQPCYQDWVLSVERSVAKAPGRLEPRRVAN
jgi:enediyne biosynthesis protein E3